MGGRCDNLKSRLASRSPLLGTFVKTPSSIIAEVLARTPLDLCCIDVEHAPFGRAELDRCIAVYRALDMPSLVRVPSDSPHDIRNALDSGATGVLVPHVTSAVQAEAIVTAAHFGEGGRGYAGSTRAAGFTTKSMKDHLADSAAQTVVVVQIEDLAALDEVGEIARVAGVDALFIGRADLAVAMDRPPSDESVIDAVRGICRSSSEAGIPVGMFTADTREIPGWIAAGASLFLLGSDQAFVLDGARRLADEFSRTLPAE